MKKSILKRTLAMATATILCLGSAFSSFATANMQNFCYTETPIYACDKDFDIISNVDALINLLYTANGTTDLLNTGLITEANEHSLKIGVILDTVFLDYKDLIVTESPLADRLYRNSEGALKISNPNFSQAAMYIGWDSAEDHTAEIEKIKQAVEEAKRIASTVPEGSVDEKLTYIYNYIDNLNVAYDFDNSSLYDELILHRGCCRGDSAAIYLIGVYAGLPVGIFNYKTSDGGYHSANYTYYEDGSIKYTDASWGRFLLADDYKR